VRFFRWFLCAFQRKIAGSDFSRQPRKGKAQGCAEQIGSGTSPRPRESPCIESRPKPATKASKYAAFSHARSKPQTLIRVRNELQRQQVRRFSLRKIKTTTADTCLKPSV
jgi:hypothetical protein